MGEWVNISFSKSEEDPRILSGPMDMSRKQLNVVQGHYTVLLNGGQVGGIPNLALNSILMVLVHLNVHQ